MTSVTFTTDVGGDNVTIDDTDSATTGLANGGHRTRFMIALQQFMKVVLWVKLTAATVLGYRDAAATSASQAQTYAAAAQSAAGVPSYAAKQNYVLVVNSGATGVQWSNALSIDTLAAKSATYAHTAPSVTLVESDQSGAVGVFRMLAEGGACRIDRNTATARDFSTLVTEWQVNSAGRHLFGGGADDNSTKFQYSGDVKVTGTLTATVGVTAANVTRTSDRRLKRDITPLVGAYARVRKVRAYRYIKGGQEELGVIAQDLAEISPTLVREGADGMLSVDYEGLSVELLAAFNEMADRLERA
ncbi:tail fiber domain-containing protein [Cupriavidus numazuensis]|uniref:Peptidase S74 domain-containing protein n=1 Tax=Cupriavidus numazuensis TaxID=221992 RepID=A0ABN7PVK9_9BURK|nr:tail fiber domain-containing protein [Cupriavidus numazuensis]CAG2129099.1 hypothetical protein LMG26411_00117 [Cupriavidus numazuensis]